MRGQISAQSGTKMAAVTRGSRIDMDVSIVAATNVPNLAACILELVSNSLNANATSIAIRIRKKDRAIQVIDNGIGIPKVQLKAIAEYNDRSFDYPHIPNVCNWDKQTLTNVRRLSNAMIITSRYYNSSKTYIKIFKAGRAPKILKIARRPSQGSTVCVRGFHELCLNKWDISLMYYLVGVIAIANPQTSFTIRDNERKKVIMIITKPHNPLDIFKLLYSKEASLRKVWYIKSVKRPDIKFRAYIGVSDAKHHYATQQIFLNNKPVHSPLILQIVATTFVDAFKFVGKEQDEWIPKKEAVFVLLFVTSQQYIFTVENGKRSLIFSSVQCFLQNIRSKITNIFVKRATPLVDSDTARSEQSIERFSSDRSLIVADLVQLFTPATPVSRNDDLIEEEDQVALSEWSSWSYPNSLKQVGNNTSKFYKRFDFLPEKLHKLLRGNARLVKTDILKEYCGSLCSTKLKSGLQIPDLLPHQEIDVRPCKTLRRFREFKLNKELLKSIKILGQMNNELIVGLIHENGAKMLLLMDQHAIHERIRYEKLLHECKSQMKSQLFFVKLKEPIVVQLSVDRCNLLLSNGTRVRKLGISFTVLNNDTVTVHTVPECLRKNRYQCDEARLKSNVESLLSELLQSFATYGSRESNNLPSIIHDAIAMEACHGAIKFGDPLSLRECRWLLKLLNETKTPTRCAHGRPSIVPLLELTNLERRHGRTVPEKLNFGALKMYRAGRSKD